MSRRTKKAIIYSVHNVPESKECNSGNEIYEWEFLDKNGKIQKDKKNIHEEIQSYMELVNYKSQIERGELEHGNIDIGSTKDFRSIPNNTIGIIELVNSMAGLSQDQISEIIQRANETTQNGVKIEQTSKQINVEAGEIKPESSTDPKPNNEGSEI